VRCDDLENLIEAIADDSLPLPAEDAAHVASCALCTARIERARSIESLLSVREVAPLPAAFTQAVMARVIQERWKAERAIDLGFNLAIAAGILVIVTAGAGLAWSLGMLSVTIDLDAIVRALDAGATGRLLSQVQTVAMSAVLLTMALFLWWWAEAASD
jgi:anti-sigma factor RsiW